MADVPRVTRQAINQRLPGVREDILVLRAPSHDGALPSS